jgi:hypothetical protein
VTGGLILKGASASRRTGEWNEDDFDVLARPRPAPYSVIPFGIRF